MSRMAQLHFERIPLTQRHLDGWAFAHPMESSQIESIEFTAEGTIVRERVSMEVFDLHNEVFPDGVRIYVTSLKRDLAAGRVRPMMMVRAHLSDEWCAYIRQSCGVEDEHLDRLTAADLERPGIMVAWTRDLAYTSTVDGSHRMCRRHRDDLRTFDMAFVAGPDLHGHIRRIT